MDAPGGYFNERGVVLDTSPGSSFERLFGVAIDDFQYSHNVARRLSSESTTSLPGFIAELSPTRARAVEYYDTGEVAVTRNKIAAGEAIVVGCEASRAAWKPGNDAIEADMRRWSLGDAPLPFRCRGGVVYRLASPAADHYFFINDGPAKTVALETPGYDYVAVSDPIEDRSLDIGEPIDLDAYSARWLRFEKA
jgi:beta-galactosidase